MKSRCVLRMRRVALEKQPRFLSLSHLHDKKGSDRGGSQDQTELFVVCVSRSERIDLAKHNYCFTCSFNECHPNFLLTLGYGDSIMHLSQATFCCLCASSQTDACFTRISCEKGKLENLETLLDQYIVPILRLSKDDKLCVCDTCKRRLFEWDLFIKSCKNAQKRLKEYLTTCNQPEPPSSTKSAGDSSSENAVQPIEASPSKLKKSSNYCIAQWCNKGNYRGVSLFRLPRERERALLWLSEAGRLDLKDAKNLRSNYLCANHFTPNMFTNNARNQLVKTAVPKIFLKPSFTDKTTPTGAVLQSSPPQFRGVQLKSILPKVNLSKSASPTSYKVLMKAAHKSRATLNPIVLCLPSQSPEETVSASAKDHNSSHLIGGRSQLPGSHDITSIVNSDLSLSHNNIVPVPQNDNFTICSSSSALASDPFNSNTQYCSVKPSNSLNLSSADLGSSLNEAENTGLRTKQRPSNLDMKEGKQYLEELESCFASDAVQLQSLSHDVSYKSIAGSQDLLLPHLSETVDKPSTFNEQSFSARSDSSVHASDSSTHSVSREPNPILIPNHNELNSPHIGIFDLPSDDIQGTESSFINNIGNLDEFMDIDKYFEGQ